MGLAVFPKRFVYCSHCYHPKVTAGSFKATAHHSFVYLNASHTLPSYSYNLWSKLFWSFLFFFPFPSAAYKTDYFLKSSISKLDFPEVCLSFKWIWALTFRQLCLFEFSLLDIVGSFDSFFTGRLWVRLSELIWCSLHAALLLWDVISPSFTSPPPLLPQCPFKVPTCFLFPS